MAEEFELTDEMRSVIGVASEPWPVEITTTSIRAFARGVGYTDARYYDEAAARAAGHAALPAPSVLPRHAGVAARAERPDVQRAPQHRAGRCATASRACSTAAPRSSTSVRCEPAIACS